MKRHRRRATVAPAPRGARRRASVVRRARRVAQAAPSLAGFALIAAVFVIVARDTMRRYRIPPYDQ